MASSAALLESSAVVDEPVTESEAETETTEAEAVPVRSRSETVRVPDVERVVSVSVSDLASEFVVVADPTEIRGASLAPEMVTVTSCVRTLISLLPEAAV